MQWNMSDFLTPYTYLWDTEAVEEATSRAARLGEQLRKSESDALEAQRLTAHADIRATKVSFSRARVRACVCSFTFSLSHTHTNAHITHTHTHTISACRHAHLKSISRA